MFEYEVLPQGRSRWSGALIFLLRRARDAAAAPLPRGALGLGEGLPVRVLLGMHLVVQAVGGQLVALFNLHL